MVTYKEIQASNALINDTTAPQVAVFAGGTSGIGKLTIKALVSTGTSIRIYLVGRASSAERTQTFIQELHTINPNAEVIWTEGEISLLAETRRICSTISARESHVDLLFLTAGYAPFSGREETAEGLEVAGSLEYYSRLLFTQCLMPLLTRAEAGRVVSVLAGGMERANSVDVNDMALRNPGSFGGMKAHTQYWAMNTLALERLAADHPDVNFIHSWPGWVDTGNVKRSFPNRNSIMAWIVWLTLEPLIALFSYSDEESAQRHLFQCTSGAFGGRGVPWNGRSGVNSHGKSENGLFLVNYKCDCTPNAKVVGSLRDQAAEKVWEHTQEVFRPYL